MEYAEAYQQCPRCEKRFRTKWETMRHMRKCRREGAKYVKIKVGGVYPCQICAKELQTITQFKQHVFYRHHEDQI